MMEPEQRIEVRHLDSGLDLELFDGSRKMAGDRFLVRFVARITIPLSEAVLPASALPEPLDAIRAALGDSVDYVYASERSFVDARERSAVFEREKASFLDTVYNYLNRVDFSVRFVVSSYRKAIERQRRLGGTDS